MKKSVMSAIRSRPNADEIMQRISNPLMTSKIASEYLEKETGIRYSENTLNHFFLKNGISRQRHPSVIDRELYRLRKLNAFKRIAADEKYMLGDLLEAFEQMTGIRPAPRTMREFRYRCGMEQKGTGQYRSLSYEIRRKRISELTQRAIKNHAIPIKNVIEMIEKETGRRFSESSICEHRRGKYD